MNNNQNLSINQTSNAPAVNSLVWQSLLNHKAQSCGISTQSLSIAEICNKIALYEGSQSKIAKIPNKTNVAAVSLTDNTILPNKLYGVLPMAIEYGFIDYSVAIDLKKPIDWANKRL